MILLTMMGRKTISVLLTAKLLLVMVAAGDGNPKP